MCRGPCPRAHGVTGTCETLGTLTPPARLTAACSSSLGKGSLALAPQQHCRAPAALPCPGNSAGPGWSAPGSAKCAGRSRWSAGTKGALAAGTVQAAGREGRSRQGGAGQGMGGCRILSHTPLPRFAPKSCPSQPFQGPSACALGCPGQVSPAGHPAGQVPAPAGGNTPGHACCRRLWGGWI